MKKLPLIPDTAGTNGQINDHTYYVIERDKKQKAWKAAAMAKCGGGCCMALAAEHFASHGITGRIVTDDEWLEIQVRQNLKQVGIKKR